MNQEKSKASEKKIGEWKFKAEIDKTNIQKITKKRDTILGDLADLGLENKRLRDELKNE